MIPRLGDGNIYGLFDAVKVFRLENDSPSRGRKHGLVDALVVYQLDRLENDSPSRGRKLRK